MTQKPSSHAVILVDFDHTLLNTKEFKFALREIFIRHGVESALFEETYNHIRLEQKAPYSVSLHMSLLFGRVPRATLDEIRTEIAELLKRTDEFLFPDVKDFLEHESRDYPLILLSLGDNEFQSLKITYAGIVKYFLQIVITQGEQKGVANMKHKVIAQYIDKYDHVDRVVVIEDVGATIDALKEQYGDRVVAIKVERPEGEYAITPSEHADYRVKSLIEARKIIENL